MCANLLGIIFLTMNTFLTNHGFSTIYDHEYVDSISQFLPSGDSNQTNRLSDIDQQGLSRGVVPKDGRSSSYFRPGSFNRPVVAGTGLGAEHDDSSVVSAMNPVSRDDLSDDMEEMIDNRVGPVLAALEFDPDDEAMKELTFNAMRSNY